MFHSHLSSWDACFVSQFVFCASISSCLEFLKVLDFEAPKSTKRLIFSCLFEILGFKKQWQMCSPPPNPLILSDLPSDMISVTLCDSYVSKVGKYCGEASQDEWEGNGCAGFEIWTRRCTISVDVGQCREKCSDQWHRAGELSMVPSQSSPQAVTLPTPVNGGRVIDTPCILECGTGFNWVY